ncbi:AAA family ATPase [Pyxidicoccus caerfyrddinensis]|uniref:AAA family ATPase n=1 Tax=Pyxidicoccus caerfyrddinensis TaxID=2709663 RepID=UPI0013DABDBC|nr:AAA family ATPase [Pyxidicoccus caerfyrddinensis]
MLFPIESVKIENFRGLRDVTLTLDPHVTVLFGSNASGKTSVLDAVALALAAYPHRLGRRESRRFGKGDLRLPWLDRPDVEERRGVEAAFAQIEVRTRAACWGVHHQRTWTEVDPAGLMSTTKLDALVDTWASTQAAQPRGASGEALPLVAAYGTERAVIAIPERERNFAEEVDRLEALDDALTANLSFKAVFEWFQIEQYEEFEERSKRRDFDYVRPALQWVRRAVERSQLRCRNPRVETRPIRMMVDFEHDLGTIAEHGVPPTEPLDITSLSDGYRTHFALVVDIARRMVQLNPSDDLNDPVRGTNTEAVILIDEVDLHLDPVWQGRVVAGLRAAFPNAQFVLTTHSEQVLGSVEAKCVRKLVWSGGEMAVESVPFAQGATGEEILVELMGVPVRVPGPVTKELEEYAALVGQDRADSPEAKALRKSLDEALPGTTALETLDLDIERRELLARFQKDDK